MSNTAFTQQALAKDPSFILRLQNALMTIAWQVLSEDPATPNHSQRASYARQVLANPNASASVLASSFVNRPNVINFTTSYDFTPPGAVINACGDADIQSQLATDWDHLAGL